MKHAPLKDALAVTKALADPQRIRILMMLVSGELCVCQVVGVLKLASSTTSRHLSVLAAAGLVEFRRDGRWAYYRLVTGAPAMNWLKADLRDDPTIRVDRAALARIKVQDLEMLCRQQRPN